MATINKAARGNPLDAEREELRKAGYNDAEVSDILVRRAIGGGMAATALGTGVVTGILNNLGAVAAHARAIIPSFKADFTNIFDRQATAATRASAVVTLSLKVTVIIVLGYIVSLEYAQFKGSE